jgi:hypothetical protein
MTKYFLTLSFIDNNWAPKRRTGHNMMFEFEDELANMSANDMIQNIKKKMDWYGVGYTNLTIDFMMKVE